MKKLVGILVLTLAVVSLTACPSSDRRGKKDTGIVKPKAKTKVASLVVTQTSLDDRNTSVELKVRLPYGKKDSKLMTFKGWVDAEDQVFMKSSKDAKAKVYVYDADGLKNGNSQGVIDSVLVFWDARVWAFTQDTYEDSTVHNYKFSTQWDMETDSTLFVRKLVLGHKAATGVKTVSAAIMDLKNYMSKGSNTAEDVKSTRDQTWQAEEFQNTQPAKVKMTGSKNSKEANSKAQSDAQKAENDGEYGSGKPEQTPDGPPKGAMKSEDVKNGPAEQGSQPTSKAWDGQSPKDHNPGSSTTVDPDAQEDAEF